MNLGRARLRHATDQRLGVEAGLSCTFGGTLSPAWFESNVYNPDEAVYLHGLHVATQQRSQL